MGLSNDTSGKAAGEGFRIVAEVSEVHSPSNYFELKPIPEGCAACSMKVNPANAYRNGPPYPIYTAAAIRRAFSPYRIDTEVNLIAMVSWSFEFEDKEYFEGFRTLATNGVDKPVMNVFRMAGLMSGQRVSTSSTGQIPLDDILSTGVRQAPDVDAFATKADHEAAVMLWNYHDDDLPATGAPAHVTIAGIPTGVKRVLLQHYRIDKYGHSNLVYGVEGDGLPADAYGRAVCLVEGGGAARASHLSGVAGRKRWQGEC